MSEKKAKAARKGERRVAAVDTAWMERRFKGRGFEWVPLDDGTEVCVWSAYLEDFLQVLDSSARPGVFAELGPDEGAAIRTQIMVSCYDGEPPMARRIFDGERSGAISLLTPGEMNRILTTSSRLNGVDQVTKEQIESFMQRNGGSSSAP